MAAYQIKTVKDLHAYLQRLYIKFIGNIFNNP